MMDSNIMPINEDETAFISELKEEIKDNEPTNEEDNIKIQLPDWDLLPPFETVDRGNEDD